MKVKVIVPEWLLKVDIRNFYENISKEDIVKALEKINSEKNKQLEINFEKAEQDKKEEDEYNKLTKTKLIELLKAQKAKNLELIKENDNIVKEANRKINKYKSDYINCLIEKNKIKDTIEYYEKQLKDKDIEINRLRTFIDMISLF